MNNTEGNLALDPNLEYRMAAQPQRIQDDAPESEYRAPVHDIKSKEVIEESSLEMQVRKAIQEGNLPDTESHGKYVNIARVMDKYRRSAAGVQGHITKHIDTTKKHTQDTLYNELMNFIGREALKLRENEVFDYSKLDEKDEADSEKLDAIRMHMREEYGLENEDTLKEDLLGNYVGQELEEEDVKNIASQLGRQKVQIRLGRAVSALPSGDEWDAHKGKGRSHHTFLQMVQDAIDPSQKIKPNVQRDKAVRDLTELGPQQYERQSRGRVYK